MLGFGGAQLVRFALNLVLTHLLFPELFGLMALVITVITGVNLFCDFGGAAIVIRDPRGDEPAFLDTVWTLQVIRGCGIALVYALVAAPVASFYGEPRLAYLIPVIGVSSLIGAFNSTNVLTLQRHMQVSRLVTLEFGVQVLSGIVMIAWAWVAPSVWALVAGNLAGAAIRLAWGHCLNVGRRRSRIGWDRSAAREIFNFGRWVWIATALTFLAGQIDRLILGKLLTLQMLGIYSIAVAFSELPRNVIQSIGSSVIFPAFSRIANLPRAELRAKILRHRWPVLAGLAVMIAALTATGDLIIRLLYDKRYADGAWMLPMLALGIWPSALSLTIHSSLSAVGQPRYAAYGNFWKTLFTAVGIPVGFAMFGIAGAVVVVALNDVPFYLQIAYGLAREGLAGFGQDAKATLLLIVLLALALLARNAFRFSLPLLRHA
jgi:O-antigen/teichoic acid export membrane protein